MQNNITLLKMPALNMLASLIFCLSWSSQVNAVTLTFEEVISGETSFSFDADADLQPDAVFTTTDPDGFNTVGPGPNQLYIQEPGLEGTTSLVPDLRIDFPNGAVGSLGFGFAVLSLADSPDLTVTFRVYDSGDAVIGSTTELAAFTQPNPPNPSGFPEGQFSLNFGGVASYATLDFDDTSAGRYIIDNFTGTFGSTEDTTAPPAPSPPAPGAGSSTPIPTISTYGLIFTALGLLLIAARRLRSSARERN